MIKRVLEEEDKPHHKDSPGIIGDDELIYRVLFIPLHINPLTGKPGLSWFTKDELEYITKGASINRKKYEGFSKCFALAKSQIGTKENKTDCEIRGANVENIRKIQYISDRVFIVIDDIIIDEESEAVIDISHGNIFILENINIQEIKKGQFNKLREMLIESFLQEIHTNV